MGIWTEFLVKKTMETENQKIDVLIIGCGPAGLTAAIYSAWLGLRTVVLDAGIADGTGT